MNNILAAHLGSYYTYPIDDALAGVAAAGFRFVELAGLPHSVTDAELGRLKALLDHHGLRAASLSGHSDLTTTEGLRSGKQAVDLCSRLGIRIMNTAIGGSEAHEREDLAAFMSHIGDLAHHAAQRDVTVALEVHGPIMATGERSIPIIREIGQPNVRINYDTGNCTFYGGVRAEDDISFAVPYLAHVHLKDTGGGLREWNFPPVGQGRVDFARVLGTLSDAGYAGPLSVEIEFYGLPWPPLEEVHRAMKASYEHLRKLGLS